jgi:hypothetical protein
MNEMQIDERRMQNENGTPARDFFILHSAFIILHFI